MRYYLYILHEAPIREPYCCKIGITHNPLKRLAQLQAGNPRFLRSPDYSRSPRGPFGIELPSKQHAQALERKVLDVLRQEGFGLMSDVNLETGTAWKREWIEGVHPDKLWLRVVEIYSGYAEASGISIDDG